VLSGEGVVYLTTSGDRLTEKPTNVCSGGRLTSTKVSEDPAESRRLIEIFQLVVFVFCPFTRASSRQGHVGIQGIMPSILLVFCPFTRTSIRPVDAGIQGTFPSTHTLRSRST
jgi:hypothetical protein